MNSQLWRLATSDFTKGLVVAILAAVFTYLAGVLNAPGFNFASFNLSEVLKIAVAAFVAYLAKNFASDANGRFLGVVGK